MSGFESNSASSVDYQLEKLIADVESKFIAAEDALADLRRSVRQLKSYRPQMTAPPIAELMTPAASPPSDVSQADVAPVQDAPAAVGNGWDYAPPAETREAAGPRMGEEVVGIPFWPGPARPEPVAESARVDVNYGLDSTSEASWPIAKPMEWQRGQPRSEAPRQPEPPVPEASVLETSMTEAREAPANEEDDEARREEVARVVAQMRDGVEDEEAPVSPEPAASQEDDHEAKRLEVARMVAELRDSVEVEPEAAYSNGHGPETEDDEARRQEVARMVAEMRAEASQPDQTEPDPGDDARRDVANIVAQMRAELGGEPPAPEAGPPDDDDVRDEVRRAVEAARAEMAPGYKTSSEESQSESRFSFPDWQNAHAEPSGPPVIVIKDSEGRVELARVYQTLSRVDCGENAALLNYTPHSVTIGLNVRSAVPEVDTLTEAIKAVFGRACQVDSDGVRVNVQIGRDLKGKDSAA